MKYSLNIWPYLLCLAISLLLMCCGGNKYEWFETYKDQKKHVYGTYILKRYLDIISGDEKSDISIKLSKYFDKNEERKGNYVFVGEAMLVDDFDAEALTEFVKAGNKAFIATNVFPNTISEKIFNPCRENKGKDHPSEYFREGEYNDFEDVVYNDQESQGTTGIEEIEIQDTVGYYDREAWEYYDTDYLNFMVLGTEMVDMTLKVNLNKVIQTDTIYQTWKNEGPKYRDWHYLHDSLACLANNNIEVLGYMNDTMINYFELPYGEGTFYIHTSPIVFTNTNLLNDKTSAYIENILAKGGDEPWHWDEYSRTTNQTGRMRNQSSDLLNSKGPLTYILKQRSLKWAWYSLLALGGFFMIFRAKRKQRVIPIVAQNENTSLTFINTIGNLYFNKNDHKQLCIDQMQLWLEDVRHHYRINTGKLDENFILLLSAKTKKPKNEIQGLLDYYNNILNGGFVSENTMVTFYQKLNQFDLKAKS